MNSRCDVTERYRGTRYGPPMKPTSLLIIVPAALLLLACGHDGLGPGDEGLQLEASIGRSTIAFGDTTSIVFRLRNLSKDTITLSFPDSCKSFRTSLLPARTRSSIRAAALGGA